MFRTELENQIKLLQEQINENSFLIQENKEEYERNQKYTEDKNN